MPIDYEIIDKNLVIVQAFGVVTSDDLSDHVFSLVNMHGETLNTDYKQIFDATKVERIDLNKEDMKNISKIVLDHGQNRGNVTIAFAAINAGARDMIGYYMQLCEVTNIKAKLFEKRLDAENWLSSS